MRVDENRARPEAPPPGTPLPAEGGLLRRFTGGFREGAEDETRGKPR